MYEACGSEQSYNDICAAFKNMSHHVRVSLVTFSVVNSAFEKIREQKTVRRGCI